MMKQKVGEVEALFRYPVKSMSGEPLEVADLGWHGLDGDRRLAFRRADDRGGFPWLTASKLPELILFAPQQRGPAVAGNLPTHVRTPAGEELAVFGQELATEVARRHGSAVEMMYLNRGIFDEASISVIASATVGEIGRLAAQPPDVRRFRPNILISTLRAVPFEEDEWVGGVLSFGEANEAAAMVITNRDERCSMVNFDPDSARPAAEVLRAIVRVRDNKAGVYGAVTRRGRLTVGQPIFFEPAGERREHL
jgi:MOSC domain-containing protein